jgi:hypothetical protein
VLLVNMLTTSCHTERGVHGRITIICPHDWIGSGGVQSWLTIIGSPNWMNLFFANPMMTALVSQTQRTMLQVAPAVDREQGERGVKFPTHIVWAKVRMTINSWTNIIKRLHTMTSHTDNVRASRNA